jgi:hypothetical protein
MKQMMMRRVLQGKCLAGAPKGLNAAIVFYIFAIDLRDHTEDYIIVRAMLELRRRRVPVPDNKC